MLNAPSLGDAGNSTIYTWPSPRQSDLPGRVVLGGDFLSQLLEFLGAVASGDWRWRAGEDEEGGWRAVKSEYDGTDAFIAY